MMDVRQKIKDWMLPIAMITGASSYLLYHVMPEPVHRAGPFLDSLVALLQPLLIFSMLFLTFCRIEPRELKPHRWHWWLLLIQGGSFTLLGLGALVLMKRFPGADAIVLIQSAMLCMICPTATAAAVVTHKLGGDIPGITTYIVLINILAAMLVPLIVPMVAPVAGLDFWMAFSMILAKVFPLLITPCLCAWLVRYLFPRIYRRILNVTDLAFYLWAVALTLAIAVTTKSIAFVDVSDFIGVLCIQFCGGKKYRREVQAKEASRSFGRSGRQESYCRTVTRAEEYRLCNLARIYLSDSGNSDHRRSVQYLAQHLQFVAAVSATKGCEIGKP